MPFALLIPSSNSSLSATMSDAAVDNLDDTLIVVEKLDRGRPRGSKNKAKATMMASTSISSVKRRGRPIGSKNKKSSAIAVGASAALDLSLAHLVLSLFFYICEHPMP
jgi:hypothetical protein